KTQSMHRSEELKAMTSVVEQGIGPKFITALLINPGKRPQKVEIEPTEAQFRELIGSTGLEVTPHPFDDYAAIISVDVEHRDEEEPNRSLSCPDGALILVFNGSFLIVGDNHEEFCSLTPKQLRRYQIEYHQPEAFAMVGDDILIPVPIPDELVDDPDQA
ncbi:MAG: DUF3846 domain-containing protein, partial [Lachnospiraceae bacterium]|nr:DUF3846 domain-containing protein [Lachnospiraceae bacterium]